MTMQKKLVQRIRDLFETTGEKPKTLAVTDDEAAELMQEIRNRVATEPWSADMLSDKRLKLSGVVLVNIAGVPFEWNLTTRDVEDIVGDALARGMMKDIGTPDEFFSRFSHPLELGEAPFPERYPEPRQTPPVSIAAHILRREGYIDNTTITVPSMADWQQLRSMVDGAVEHGLRETGKPVGVVVIYER